MKALFDLIVPSYHPFRCLLGVAVWGEALSLQYCLRDVLSPQNIPPPLFPLLARCFFQNRLPVRSHVKSFCPNPLFAVSLFRVSFFFSYSLLPYPLSRTFVESSPKIQRLLFFLDLGSAFCWKRFRGPSLFFLGATAKLLFCSVLPPLFLQLLTFFLTLFGFSLTLACVVSPWFGPPYHEPSPLIEESAPKTKPSTVFETLKHDEINVRMNLPFRVRSRMSSAFLAQQVLWCLFPDHSVSSPESTCRPPFFYNVRLPLLTSCTYFYNSFCWSLPFRPFRSQLNEGSPERPLLTLGLPVCSWY